MFHVQTFTVGVTGHRPNRLHIGEARVRKRVRDALISIRSGAAEAQRRRIVAQRPQLCALSALAEGADRIFAAEALELGFVLHVLLPFPSKDYESTFTDPAGTPAYRDLLARADTVSELPGRLSDPEGAYGEVGRATEKRCDLLMTIWDGRPAAGPGGTPEVVDQRLAVGKPVVWIDASRDRLSLLQWSRSHLPRPSLERLARRARPATRPEIGLIVADMIAAKANHADAR